MKNRLTKLLTTFLAVVLLVGMSPAAASTAYAASWNSGTVASFSWLDSIRNLFGKSDKNDSESNGNQNQSQTEQNYTTAAPGNTQQENSADTTGTAEEIKLTKTATDKNETDSDGNPLFDIKLGVQGKQVTKGAPVDVTLVVDLSNSMTNDNSQSLAITKAAAQEFIEKVLPEQETGNVRVSIVAYGSNAYAYNFAKSEWQTYGSTFTDGFYTKSRKSALNVIKSDSFAPGQINKDSGGTNTEAGFRVTKAVTDTRNNSKASSVVVFMTDGVPTWRINSSGNATNDGAGNQTSDAEFNEAVGAAQELKAAGNDIYTVGLLTESTGDKLTMANKLLAGAEIYGQEEGDNNSYNIGDSISYEAYSSDTTNYDYYRYYNNNLWTLQNGTYYKVSVNRTGGIGNRKYTYTYSGGSLGTYNNSLESPGIQLYKQVKSNEKGYYSIGPAYSTKYYPITQSEGAGDKIIEIYKNIAEQTLALATGTVVDQIPDEFELTAESKANLEAAGYKVSADGKTITFEGIKAGLDKKELTFTVKYTGDKYGSAYTNTQATYTGTLYDDSSFGPLEFTKPVVGLNPKTADDSYVEPIGTVQLGVLGNDPSFEKKITDDGYEVSDFAIEIVKQPTDATATANGQNVSFASTKSGTYTFTYIVKATATKGDKVFNLVSRETTVTVNVVAAANKAFVVDFGKPVTYDAKDVFSNEELQNSITKKSGTDRYGKLTLNEDKSITYKLNKFMEGIDQYIFGVNCKGVDLDKTVSMVPASSIYYEDNFADEDGNTLIHYGEGWKVAPLKPGKDEVINDIISGVAGDGNLGYDSAYDTSDSQLVYSAGTIHYVPKSTTAVTADFTFKGQGIDLYSYTSGATGKFTFRVYDGDTRVFNKTINTKYNSGEAYQVPVVTFMGKQSKNYRVQIIVPKNNAFYLDAVRIYNSVNVNKEQIGGVDVDNESSAKFVSIREQSLLSNNADLFTVDGDVFIDAYLKKNAKVVAIPKEMTEYTTYGRKTEVVVAPRSSVTLTLKNASKYSKVQLGARIDAAIPSVIDGVDLSKVNTNGKVLVNNEEINIKSSTDMYYTVKIVDRKLVITNNTNKLLALTKLKLVEKVEK
ncbi:vWA domain-containing protein [Intestinibacter bartlettii]|uniref:vWA domain-containing protein n=1 Tax=Intestinibacter bartlettii TaxID=261299 RepID=UPI0026DB0CD2|nr:vWA domain-containing protein [Intestinibacter bartlettii]